MSVVTILKGKEKWPEIYNFLKKSPETRTEDERTKYQNSVAMFILLKWFSEMKDCDISVYI